MSAGGSGHGAIEFEQTGNNGSGLEPIIEPETETEVLQVSTDEEWTIGDTISFGILAIIFFVLVERMIRRFLK